MNNGRLRLSEEFIRARYRDQLGIEIPPPSGEIALDTIPAWRYVSQTDLLSTVEPDDPDAVGLLLDPGLGIMFYLIPYEAESKLRPAINRSLSVRSRLRAENVSKVNSNSGFDINGSWRVVLTFLVAPRARQAWINEACEIRSQTGFFEEVTIDAVFFGDLQKAASEPLERHGLPRLLLTAREILQKRELDDVEQWRSADTLVRDALKFFDSEFRNPKQKALAVEIAGEISTFRPSTATAEQSPIQVSEPGKMESLRITKFRNLDDITIAFGSRPQESVIIHGPNGTGKSAICEAFSLGLFGYSERYGQFANKNFEKDVSARDRATEYLNRYLTPIGDSSTPRVAINGGELGSLELCGEVDLDERLLCLDGVILTQETSAHFAKLSANDLGAKVLRGYSRLADHIAQHVESRSDQANQQRQSFLRDLGLTTAIKKIDTALERIARKELDVSAPALKMQLVTWLENVGKRGMSSAAVETAQRWRNWGGDAGRNLIAQEIASNHGTQAGIANCLTSWLDEYNELAERSTAAISEAESKFKGEDSNTESHMALAEVWGAWLHQRAITGDQFPAASVVPSISGILP